MTKRTLAGLSLAALVSSACGEPGEPAPYLPPGEAGPFVVGTAELLVPSGSGPELTVQVWYPSSEPGLDPHTYDGLIPAEAYDDLAPDCSAPRPLVVFSHGSGGVRWQSAYLPEHLAARGSVVLAPDHLRNTFRDDDPEALGELLLRRPADVRAAVDWLVGEAASPASSFHRCLAEPVRYEVMGHSFGGYTALALGGATIGLAEVDLACAAGYAAACDLAELARAERPGEDPLDLGDGRVGAVLGLAPWDGGVLGPGLAGVGLRTALVAATGDTSTPLEEMVRPMFETLEARPRYLVEIADAGHGSFIGLCPLTPTVEGCGPEFRPADEVAAVVRSFAAAFVDLVRGDRRARDWLVPEADGVIMTALE